MSGLLRAARSKSGSARYSEAPAHAQRRAPSALAASQGRPSAACCSTSDGRAIVDFPDPGLPSDAVEAAWPGMPLPSFLFALRRRVPTPARRRTRQLARHTPAVEVPSVSSGWLRSPSLTQAFLAAHLGPTPHKGCRARARARTDHAGHPTPRTGAREPSRGDPQTQRATGSGRERRARERRRSGHGHGHGERVCGARVRSITFADVLPCVAVRGVC